ncbi:amidase domain-containing protein [Filibacter tadaridae]|nr:amidase domain-containing protein [Filibacter tadaridae]
MVSAGIGTANAAESVNPEEELLPSSIGENVLDRMLKQQEKDFESKNPLRNKEITKLTETDETVLFYRAMTEVDNRPLLDFNYEVSDVKVYKNKENQLFVEAYVVRKFQYFEDGTETGFGDFIKLQINKSSKKMAQETAKISSSPIESDSVDNAPVSNIEKEVQLLSISSEKDSEISADEFLENYKKEKNKEPESVTPEQTEEGQQSALKTSSVQKAVYSAAASYTYNRSKSVYYATTHALNPNTRYPYFASAGDCTNFVLQSLHAGDIPMMGDWFMRKGSDGVWKYGYSWIHADEFRKYLLQTGGILMKTMPNTYSNAQLGDIYHYDARNKFGLPITDGVMEHAAIVTKKTSGQVLVSYHTTNRLNVPQEYYSAQEGGVRYLSHIY